jgi:uncharacterized RDD family membrane protein YckC
MFYVFYVFFGFDEIIANRNSDYSNIEYRQEFLVVRNTIRELSFLVWISFCFIFESTPLRGSLGKKALDLIVVSSDDRPLTIVRIAIRNVCKILSYLPIGLGFWWGIFSKSGKTWHDMISKTIVIRKPIDS